MPDTSVDVFFSITVFQHNARETVFSIMNDARRVLRPGGIACFQLPVYEATTEAAPPPNPLNNARWTVSEFGALVEPWEIVSLAPNDPFGYHVLRNRGAA
jgi:hypothetical protein